MISAIVVSYQTGAVLWDCLTSLIEAPEIGEVIVVDNGNPEHVSQGLFELAEEEHWVHLLAGHGNVGFAKGCNLGASKAMGTHLLFVNPDAILAPGAAHDLQQAGKASNAEHWAAGPKLTDPDGTEQRGSRRDILTPWNAFVEASRLYRLMPNHPRFKRFNDHEAAPITSTSPVPCLSGACFLVPRTTWDGLHGMDPRYFLHVEDVDFFLRLNKIGGLALYVPSVVVAHHKSSSQVDPLFVERRKKQSLNLYFATHFKDVYPPGFLTLLRAMLWTSFAFRSLTFRFWKRR
ncbi:MAG: glycosyltransferase family 2 protein [Parvularculaceae bacterium]|nr:glycosyltransferase family 2 protein [Parvularculaceae bacterium]